jgi:hypothetical protein
LRLLTAMLRSEALRLQTAARLRRRRRLAPIGPSDGAAETRTAGWWVYSRPGSRFVSGVVLPRGNVRRDFIDHCESPLRCETDCGIVSVGLPLHRQAPMQGAPLAPSPWRGFCLGAPAPSAGSPPMPVGWRLQTRGAAAGAFWGVGSVTPRVSRVGAWRRSDSARRDGSSLGRKERSSRANDPS